MLSVDCTHLKTTSAVLVSAAYVTYILISYL